MHLKSLTLKGFKSFASATTLSFEPGITCVVGPNGSGKSNVVDAIAWVLGEQGAKTLRGGKMEDVIFGGTTGRPPLGRAEVTLTIDNADGLLPVDYTEVSITRRMYRSGESEYEMNRAACRLLDIQELLSDSGIGREMHVIVGQGQLDSVLQARPEDRRAFIEEAAGVLKHRKRKEKALRKLDAMQVNLTRLTDLTAELRRQLKPLGRQAEVARRAAAVQADLRDARLRLLTDDLVQLRAELEREVADEIAIRDRRGVVEGELAATQRTEADLDEALTTGAAALARVQEMWYRLSALQERIRGTARLAAERARFLAEQHDDTRPGRDPETLDREVEQLRLQEVEQQRSLDAQLGRRAEIVDRRQSVEAQLGEAEHALVIATRGAADRREGLVRLVGEVNALRTRAAAGADEIARLSATLADARQRAERAQVEFDRLQREVGALGDSELGLDERYEAAKAVLDTAQAQVRQLTEAEHAAKRERSSWTARCEALELGLRRRDGAGSLLAGGDRPAGLIGAVATLLRVRPGYQAAVAAALGPVADAVAVSSLGEAAQALTQLKRTDGGRAGLWVAGQPPGQPAEPLPALPDSVQWLRELVEAPDALLTALDRALYGVAVVSDLQAARLLIQGRPDVRAVTTDGDLLGADWAVGGSASVPSTLEIQATLDEARAERGAAEARCRELLGQLAAARQEAGEREAGVADALVALHVSDAELAAVSERLGELGAAVRSATAEAERLERARVAAEEARDRDLGGMAALEERLRAGEAAPAGEEPSTEQRDTLASEAGAVREAEMEARLAVRTAEERVRALAARTSTLRRAAADERAARARAEATRLARARGAVVSAAVVHGAQAVLARLSESLAQAAAEREAIQQARAVREGELLAARQSARELAAELDRLTDVVHRDEVARAEQCVRIEALEARAAQDHGIEVDTLIAEYGPDIGVPYSGPEPAEGEPLPEPAPYDRTEQERRAARAERDLALLGRVNPLALEEFGALEERHAFLSAQLEDLRDTRRDLLTVIKEVDERIHDVFAAAFADTAREFEVVFATLFPGGEGRLVLTDPDDLSITGVEVEARPPGKRIKRLSLLSGGERSLTAVALLVAIFRARPSPFYVLDEIEAALDDVNLGRLIGLIEELRAASQLIIVTHQKRTMEVADALYGTSMRDDGLTTVISQRLRELETA